LNSFSLGVLDNIFLRQHLLNRSLIRRNFIFLSNSITSVIWCGRISDFLDLLLVFIVTCSFGRISFGTFFHWTKISLFCWGNNLLFLSLLYLFFKVLYLLLSLLFYSFLYVLFCCLLTFSILLIFFMLLCWSLDGLSVSSEVSNFLLLDMVLIKHWSETIFMKIC